MAYPPATEARTAPRISGPTISRSPSRKSRIGTRSFNSGLSPVSQDWTTDPFLLILNGFHHSESKPQPFFCALVWYCFIHPAINCPNILNSRDISGQLLADDGQAVESCTQSLSLRYDRVHAAQRDLARWRIEHAGEEGFLQFQGFPRALFDTVFSQQVNHVNRMGLPPTSCRHDVGAALGVRSCADHSRSTGGILWGPQRGRMVKFG